MAIEGPLRELGLHDVFQLLDLSRKTGKLTITSVLRDNMGTVYFDRGGVIHAYIKSNPHPLGELLLRAGKITEGDLTRLREQQRREGGMRKIGELLVEAGALSRRELERHVRFQLEEVVFEMMSWREGFFSFEEGEVLDAPAEADIRITTESLLMEGARRIDEWSLIVGKVPHVGMIPWFAAIEEDHAALLDLLPKEWEVLGQIDGQRNIREIATVSAMSEFDVARVMYGLITTGIVELKPGEDPALTVSGIHPAVRHTPPKADAGVADAGEKTSSASANGGAAERASEEASALPGALLHVPSLERTAMHPVASAAVRAEAGAAESASAAAARPRATPVSLRDESVSMEDALRHLDRARDAMSEGDHLGAVLAAREAVLASGGSVEACVILARAQLKSGQVEDATATVRAALSRDPLHPALYLLLGACAASRGALAEAVTGWERYARLAPDAADAARVRGVAEAAGRLRDALRELVDV